MMKQLVLAVIVWGCFGSRSLPAQADVHDYIRATEQLPRIQRIVSYFRGISHQQMTSAKRKQITLAFAKHVKKISPRFGRKKWDGTPWIAALQESWDSDPTNLDVALALGQFLIDEGRLDEAHSVAKQFQAAFPSNHEANAWAQFCDPSIRKRRSKLLEFPVFFCLLTKNARGRKVATEAQCRKEVDILNATFRTDDGKPLVKFVFKGFSGYTNVASSNDPLAQYGDSTRPYNSDAVARAFNACNDPALRDRNAINFYIFDAYGAKEGFGDVTSHGKRNSNRPYVMLDYERLNNRIQNAEAHEMGHAFGLGHVGVPNATGSTSTNIMTSASEKFGSGGKRDLGFTPSQSAVILYHAERTFGRLGLSQTR